MIYPRFFISKLLKIGLLCLSLLFPTCLFAQAVNREDLFKRSFQSLAFLMGQASFDNNFRSSLTEAEVKMFIAVISIAQDYRNRQWHEENKIFAYQSKGHNVYFYVPRIRTGHPFYMNPENIPVQFASPASFKLQFSDDRNQFKLNPQEPERSAMTWDQIDKDVFINRHMVNSADQNISFAEAIALSVHELGHKTTGFGLEKDQAAIDSLAAKLRFFIENQTTTVKFQNGKLHVIKFSKAPVDEWTEKTLNGIYQEVNVPPKYESLAAVDGEGTIFFIETAKGIHDITPEIVNQISNRNLTRVQASKAFDWKNLNWILGKAFEVNDYKNGKISINFSFDQFQMSVPFMNGQSPDPRQYDPWKNAFTNSPPYFYKPERVSIDIDTASNKPNVLKMRLLPLMFEDPTVKVEKIYVEWQKNDFVAKYKILNKPKVKWEGGDLNLRPYLILKIGTERVEIASSAYSSDQTEFEYRIPGVKDKISERIEIVGIEMAAAEPNLAITGEGRIKAFVKTYDFLNPDVEAVKKSDSGFELKEIQFWNGDRFLSAKQAELSKNPISHARLVFNSDSYLVSLKLMYAYAWNGHTYSQISYAGESSEMQKIGEFIRPAVKWVSFDLSKVKQTVSGSNLYVDVPINQDLKLTQLYEVPLKINAPDLPGWMRSGKDQPMQLATEYHVSFAGAARVVAVVEAVNQSLVPTIRDFDEPLKFNSGVFIDSRSVLPNNDKSSAVRSCKSIYR
jgi:hypothetical protein